jgi:hypothetical protein
LLDGEAHHTSLHSAAPDFLSSLVAGLNLERVVLTQTL